jgi:hypothetical protein
MSDYEAILVRAAADPAQSIGRLLVD